MLTKVLPLSLSYLSSLSVDDLASGNVGMANELTLVKTNPNNICVRGQPNKLWDLFVTVGLVKSIRYYWTCGNDNCCESCCFIRNWFSDHETGIFTKSLGSPWGDCAQIFYLISIFVG
jgi:hypothetical protein